jgi:hypothetical protein
MAPAIPTVDQHRLFEEIRLRLVRFVEVPDHRPCGDPRCVYCREVEGRRIFVLLKSLGNYLRKVEPAS